MIDILYKDTCRLEELCKELNYTRDQTDAVTSLYILMHGKDEMEQGTLDRIANEPSRPLELSLQSRIHAYYVLKMAFEPEYRRDIIELYKQVLPKLSN
jgi:hypothetical protein